MIKTILKDCEDRMHKASEVVRQELARIRTGKATTALLDSVKVEYYGSTMALNHVANVTTPTMVMTGEADLRTDEPTLADSRVSEWAGRIAPPPTGAKVGWSLASQQRLVRQLISCGYRPVMNDIRDGPQRGNGQ